MKPRTTVSEVRTFRAFGAAGTEHACRSLRCERVGEYSHGSPAVLCCGNGVHATVMPLQVLHYFSPATSEFREVEVTEVTALEAGGERTVVGRRSRIGPRIELAALVEAQVEFVLRNAKRPAPGGLSAAVRGLATATGESEVATASGSFGAATAAGDYGIATASGDSGVAMASGSFGVARVPEEWGVATASGLYGAAAASHYRGVAAASGIGGVAMSSGNLGVAVASGPGAAATASGSDGVAVASDDSSAATATGRNGAAMASGEKSIATAAGDKSIAFAAGYSGMARATLGNWIVVAERDDDFTIIGVQSARVDGERIKANTFYALRGGRLVEAGDPTG